MLLDSSNLSLHISFLILVTSFYIANGAELGEEAKLDTNEIQLPQIDEQQPTQVDGLNKLLVDVEINGRRVTVPYFDPQVTEITPQKRAFDTSAVKQFGDLLVSLFYDIVINKKTLSLGKYPVKVYKLVQKLGKESDDLSEKGVCKHMDDEFTLDGLQIYRDMKNFSQEQDKVAAQSKVNNKKAPKDTAEQQKAKDEAMLNSFKDFMDIVVETVKQSPVGFYVRWSQMKMDGEPIGHRAAEYYDYFKKNGFSTAIWVVDQTVSLVSKWKSKSQ